MSALAIASVTPCKTGASYQQGEHGGASVKTLKRWDGLSSLTLAMERPLINSIGKTGPVHQAFCKPAASFP